MLSYVSLNLHHLTPAYSKTAPNSPNSAGSAAEIKARFSGLRDYHSKCPGDDISCYCLNALQPKLSFTLIGSYACGLLSDRHCKSKQLGSL